MIKFLVDNAVSIIGVALIIGLYFFKQADLFMCIAFIAIIIVSAMVRTYYLSDFSKKRNQRRNSTKRK